MKILWLTNYPYLRLEPHLGMTRPRNGHPSSWIVNLASALARRTEINLHILTLCPHIRTKKSFVLNDLKFDVLPSGVPFLDRGFPYYLPLDVMSRFYFERRRLVKEIGKIKPDVVHAHGTEGAFGLAGIESGYPCLVSMQGIIGEYAKVDPSFRYSIVKHYEKSVIVSGKFFSCRTHFDINFVSSINHHAKIYTIHETMNPVFFGNDWHLSDNQNILFVGALQKRKGVEPLLDSISIVKKHFHDVLLFLIGHGVSKYVKYLKKKCRELRIEANVKFLGHRSSEEIAAYHRECQLFILSSVIENSPNVVAEAMISGLPVIATNVGGVPSMIEHGKTGVLVEWNDIEGLAEQIVRLLNNPKARLHLAGNARRVARKRHHPESIARKTIEAYKEILNLGSNTKRNAKYC